MSKQIEPNSPPKSVSRLAATHPCLYCAGTRFRWDTVNHPGSVGHRFSVKNSVFNLSGALMQGRMCLTCGHISEFAEIKDYGA